MHVDSLNGFAPDAFNYSSMLKDFNADNNKLEGKIPFDTSATSFSVCSQSGIISRGPIPPELTELDQDISAGLICLTTFLGAFLKRLCATSWPTRPSLCV